MEQIRTPQIHINKHVTPTIYLDTCAMIELARYENGKCTNAHKNKIKDLYSLLTSMMHESQILCPLGNQLQEMGMTRNREKAKRFLYKFTNAKLFHPSIILDKQLKAGYNSCICNNDEVVLDISTVFQEDEEQHSRFCVRIVPVYSSEKAEALCREKNRIVEILNEMKTNNKTERDFDSQLAEELLSDYKFFIQNIVNNPQNSESDIMKYLNEIHKLHRITGHTPNSTLEQIGNEFANYTDFLLGLHYTSLPFIWIRANLWAHLMQRPNKIQIGDYLDVEWASAYLPFVDFAVTDGNFCDLLKKSGLADLYKTKVFSLKTLSSLMDELENLRKTTHEN